MRITVNGETREYPDNTTILQIMEDLRITGKVMACAVNMAIVKKEAWDTTAPQEGDKLEMLHFVGGG